VAQTGTAYESEDRNTGMRRPRTDPRHRNRDQPRVRVAAVLGHDERAAVGAVAAVLRRVVARVQRQLPSSRPGGHGNSLVAAAEVEVREPEGREAAERARDDP